MNIVEAFRRDELRVLDRLVDGELSQSERRELIASLDDEPAGWRRCALAFLEAQNFRWQLSRMAAEPIVAQAGAARPAPLKMTPAWRFGKFLALAASLLLAFTLGARFETSRVQPPDQLVAQQDTTPPPEAFADDLPLDDLDSNDFDSDDNTSEVFTLAWGDDEDAEPIQVKAVEADADQREWFTDDRSALPVNLLREFTDAGLEVVSRRRFLPVDLSDGRHMIVPVEQVDVRHPRLVEY